MESPPPTSAARSSWVHHFGAALLYLALALAATFPLWMAPASRIEGLGDSALNAYILWWSQNALFHRLADFFQADYFWPHADALAYGEHLIAPALLALPFKAVTDSAVAVHNLSLVQAFFFCALAAHALAWFTFRSIGAAMVAGVMYGFAAYRLTHVSHLQLVHGEFLPLMVLGFDRALATGRRRWTWLLGFAALGQWLTSWYWAVFSLGCLGPYFAVRLWRAWREPMSSSLEEMQPETAAPHGRSYEASHPRESSPRSHRRRVMGAVAALIIAAGFTLPAAIPYLDLSRRNALVRPEVAFEGHSARLFDFLAPFDRSLVYGTINEELAPVVGERTLFPGAITFFLVIMSGFLWWKTRAERRAAASDGSREPDFAWGLWILIGAVTIVFCFGPEARVGDGGTSIPLPYALFQKLAPFADQMRVPARWMLPALLPASLLAAATMHAITRGDPRAARFLTVLIVGGLVMESVGRPIATVEIATSPRAVDVWLAERTYPSPALELPLRPADDNTPMLDATRHGQPIVNGTNGYFPPDYRAWMRAASELPSAEAWRTLRQYQHDPAIAIRYIIFDLGASADASGEWNEERVEETIARIGEAFAARRDFGEIVVLELRRGEAR